MELLDESAGKIKRRHLVAQIVAQKPPDQAQRDRLLPTPARLTVSLFTGQPLNNRVPGQSS
jgi:hypothetical protein